MIEPGADTTERIFWSLEEVAKAVLRADDLSGLSSLRASAAQCTDAESLKGLYVSFFEDESFAELRSWVTEAAGSPSFVFNQTFKTPVDSTFAKWLDYFSKAANAGSVLPGGESLEAGYERYSLEGEKFTKSFEDLRREFVRLNRSRNSLYGPGFGVVPFHSRIVTTAGSSEKLTRPEHLTLDYWFYEQWYALYPEIIQTLHRASEGFMRVFHGFKASQRQRVKN